MNLIQAIGLIVIAVQPDAGPVPQVADAGSRGQETVPACAAICEAIGHEIESLKPDHPQLGEFSATGGVDRRACVVSYSHHTQRPAQRGGWTSGFPAPDLDGISFYIHLYDRDDQAGQIDTQPVLPLWFIGPWRVTFLILEGEKTVRSAARIHNRLAYLGMRVKGEKGGKQLDMPAVINSEVVVTGIARDAKMGAVVVTEDGGAVYLRGMDAWPAHALGKTVFVLGKLSRADFPIAGNYVPGHPVSQGFEGQPPIIEKPRWRLAP